jgi:hypothetical protein
MLHSNNISRDIPIFSMSGNSVAPLAMQCDIRLKPKYKLAAVKPEMVINPQAKYQKRLQGL